MLYKQTTVIDEISSIWKQDIESLCSAMESRGLLFIIAFLCISAICIAKSVLCLFNHTGIRYEEPKRVPTLSMTEMSRRLMLEELEDFNSPVAKSVYDDSIEEVSPKANALCSLRNHLIKTRGNLKGTIIKTTFPKITGEELLEHTTTGKELSKPFVVQRITFGEDLNKLLKIAFKESIKHRKVRGQESTYIVFEGNDLLELENKLRKVFINESIKIRLNTLQ